MMTTRFGFNLGGRLVPASSHSLKWPVSLSLESGMKRIDWESVGLEDSERCGKTVAAFE